MAITWKKRTKVDGKEVWIDDGVTHVGLVMGHPTTAEERVMSDVYAPVTRVQVWDPKTKAPASSHIALAYHFECGSREGTSLIDLDPKILKAWGAKAAAAAAKQVKADVKARKAKRESEARDSLLSVEKGTEVVVVKGRKVPKGTRGVVFWMKDTGYGPRIGMKNAQGEEFWTAAKNVVPVFPGVNPEDTPPGGWEALRLKVLEAQAVWAATLPEKGDKVRHLKTGEEGKIFWIGDGRLGMKLVKSANPTWCKFNEVVVIKHSITPPKAIEPDPKVAIVGAAFRNLEQVPAAIAAMPFPYCDIRSLKEETDGTFTALGEAGNTILQLTASSARKITTLLAG